MIEVAFRHNYGTALLDIAFTAPTPGITVMFGPSGAGKSSVIAALAGLLRPADARLAVDGAVLCDTEARLWVPPERRRLGMVFQDARLFPHLSVQGNLRYGLRRAPPGAVGFADVTGLLGLAPLLGRRPHTLSGGERQRVAIGRALLSQPRLLLMDEPLAALDSKRRAEILPFVIALNRRLGIPIVYVTHALAELAALATTVVLIEAGRVIASGSLAEISARGDLPLAGGEGAGAILPARVLDHDPARRLTRLLTGGTSLLVPLQAVPPDTPLRLRVPADDIALVRAEAGWPSGVALSIQNVVPATVRGLHALPARQLVAVELELGGAALLARITADAVARLSLAAGTPVLALVKSAAVEVLAG